MGRKKQNPSGNGADKATESTRTWQKQHGLPEVPKRPVKPSPKGGYTGYD